jgi:mannitol/fructose-specific phosphotransferase system IIA component (Ntr-type)
VNQNGGTRSAGGRSQLGAGTSLCDLLDPGRVVLQLEATDKKAILAELSSLLVADQPKDVQGAILDALIQREEVGSTGIGDGVAIPHARTAAVQTIRVAAGVCQEGLDFQSLDGEPVYVFFLILTPVSASGAHLKLLSELTRLLRFAQVREALRSATTAQEFCQVLRAAASGAMECGS